MSHETITVRRQGPVCRVRFDRPEHDNAINDAMIRECHEVLDSCERDGCGVVLFEGATEAFCVGADFTAFTSASESEVTSEYDPAPLYDLWLRMATGPYVTLSHVQGRANAGGVGFVAASDIVLAHTSATFGLSELLFGLYPAMVLPFLTRRVGYQRANYLTLTTRAVDAPQAAQWGLVDRCADSTGPVLAQHLGRLSKLSPDGIARYKRFMNEEIAPIRRHREAAVSANVEIFSDERNLRRITRFVENGVYPWEELSQGSESSAGQGTP